MRLRTSLVTGLCACSLALLGLACEVEEDAGEELIPDNGTEEGDSS